MAALFLRVVSRITGIPATVNQISLARQFALVMFSADEAGRGLGLTSAASLFFELLEQRRLLADVRFAVIGDFGMPSGPVIDVANMIKSFNPDFITTVGDNNYDTGQATTIDPNIGQHFHEYIYNYQGTYGAGSKTRRFFPTLGNHDWGNTFPNPAGADPYLAYFDLPVTTPTGGERYYDFVAGPVHFFMLDSDPNEPDGDHETSVASSMAAGCAGGFDFAASSRDAASRPVYLERASELSDDAVAILAMGRNGGAGRARSQLRTHLRRRHSLFRERPGRAKPLHVPERDPREPVSLQRELRRDDRRCERCADDVQVLHAHRR